MPRSSFAAVVVSGLLALSALLALPGAAQRPATSVTVTTALSYVDFDSFGGVFGAFVGQVAIARRLSGAVGVEWSAFALAPGGSATADVACQEDQRCTSPSTPSALVGTLLAPVVELGTSGIRVSAGGGIVRATGGSGFAHRSSIASALAMEWRPRTRSRISPSAGVRLVNFAQPVGGARYVVIPGIGVSF
ncbi:MAG: hypothetical protein ABI910_05260 [Gemmatimonadota bacterium]